MSPYDTDNAKTFYVILRSNKCLGPGKKKKSEMLNFTLHFLI